MDIKPFTLEEAEEISEDFEDLKDSEFTLSGVTYIVEDVLITPFDAAEKDVFFATYDIGTSDFQARYIPDGVHFDVTLVVSNLSMDEGFSFMGIRQYVAEKGVNYNFP